MPFTHLTTEEVRGKCKHRLELLELWLRRLIHDKLSAAYGDNYFDHQLDGQNIFRNEIRDNANNRIANQPNRYPRKIDALLLDDLVSIVCKPQLFSQCFKLALKNAFPEGNSEARTFLSRIVGARNPLAHANPISYHQAAQVFCYTEDVIQSIREHYSEMGEDSEFNAPAFVAFRDSSGHSEFISSDVARLNFETTFRPGDQIRLEVDIDDSFSADECTIQWMVANISDAEKGTGNAFVLDLLPKHVSERFLIIAKLRSDKDWHKHGNFDAQIIVTYKVLPPIS